MAQRKDLGEVKLAEIIPYENNPRKNEPAVKAVMNSISEFDFLNPIIVDENMVILAGHTRLIASQRLGLLTAPCIMATGLSEDQKKAYRLVDNKSSELAEWDLEKLTQELSEIDLDMSDFGFDDMEIEQLDPEVVEDEVPESAEQRCQKGDIWKLGNHRLMCGNSTDINAVERLLGGVLVDLGFTSPPYNVGESAKLSGTKHMKECKYESGDDNLDNYYELIYNSTVNSIMQCKYSFVNLQMVSNNKQEIIQYLNDFKDNLCDIAIWKKTTTAPAMANRVMNSQFEFIFIFSKDNNSRAVGTRDFRGNISNVYEGSPQRNNDYSDKHSATFPVHLPEHFIKNFTNENDSVLDLFGGTGTTLVVCEQLNRICYMMELDPKYCDIIIDRWERLTGNKAELID